jgi:hypothetical protein
MQDPKDNKKRFNVRGLRFGEDPSTFAGQLADAMNELSADGYDVEIMGIPAGFLVMGKLEKDPEETEGHPLQQIFSKIFEVKSDGIPPRIDRLIKHLAVRVKSDNYDILLKEIPVALPPILREVPTAAVREMADECEEFATRHDKNAHGDECDCSISIFMRAMAKEMRGYAKLQVQ